MTLQKGTLNGLPILEDSSSVGIPVTDLNGSAGDIIAGIAGHVAKARSPIVIDTISAMQSLSGSDLIDGQIYQTLGNFTIGDGGSRFWRYVASSSQTISNDVINGPGGSGRFLANDLISQPYINNGIVATNASDGTFAWRSETSTFSGWGCMIGADHAPFDIIRIRVRSWDGSDPVTNIRVRVRAGGPFGPVLADAIQVIDGSGETQEFSLSATVDCDADLWLEYVTDGKCGIYSYVVASSDKLAKGVSRYTTGGTTNDSVQSPQTSMTIMWFELDKTISPKISTTSKRLLRALYSEPLPQIGLTHGAQLAITTNRTAQLFRRGLLECVDPYKFDVDYYHDLDGKQYRRYYEVAPVSPGIVDGAVVVKNGNGRIVAARDMRVHVHSVGTSPASNINVLCVGDSLTANGTWITEFRRMLVGTGGSPAGAELTNITLIGSQGSSPNLHEGYSGRSWNWFANEEDSPFVASGSLNVDAYATANSIASIDVVIFLLSWNGFLTSNAYTYEDWDNIRIYARDIIEAFRTYNSSVKVLLLGLQTPSPDGQADDYGDWKSSSYASANHLRRAAYAHNQMLARLAGQYRTAGGHMNDAFTAPVAYVEVAARFDSENNMPAVSKAVNTRNSTTESIGNNGVHPAAEGYYQIADAAFDAFNSMVLN